MKTEVFLSIKFLSGKGRSFISGITLLSTLGVMLGVMVPIVVLSVMGGFQEKIKEKILGLDGHITIQSISPNGIEDWQKIVDNLNKESEISSTYAFSEMQGLVQLEGSYQPVIVRGLPTGAFAADKELSKLMEIESGSRDINKPYYILLGSVLAENNYLSTGDRLSLLIFPSNSLSPSNLQTKTIRTEIGGVFKTGYQEYDYGMIFTSLETLLQSNQNNATQQYPKSISIKLNDIWNSAKVKKRIHEMTENQFIVLTWQEKNSIFFRALALEKTLMHLVMSFILIVAIFNVTSGQLVQVIERKKEIGILKTVGFTPWQIASIFLVQGLIITTGGAVLGATLGTLIAIDVTPYIKLIEITVNFFLSIWHFLLLVLQLNNGEFVPFRIYPQDLYYLDFIPTQVSITRAFTFIGLAMLFSLLAGIIPSLKAGKIRPVEIMRYE